MSMTEEQLTKLTTSLTDNIKAGFTTLIQKFEEAMPKKNGKDEKEDDEDEKEMLAAAGVTDGDDEATKKEKIEKYQASKKPVTQMSAKDVSDVVSKSMLQFFRQTGGKPAKAHVDGDGGGTKKDEFEVLIDKQLELGAKNRGRAIQLARQLNGAAYNAWMAKKHPNVQTMEAKK